MKRALLSLSAIFGLMLGFCSQPREIHAADAQPPLEPRIREDFYARFRGDRSAPGRAATAAPGIPDAQPAHAEALVFLGSATLALSGRAYFEEHDMQKGMDLWERGQAMVDKAVEVQPDNIDVRKQRGMTLLVASRQVPVHWQPTLLEKCLADFNRILEPRKDNFASLPVRDRGGLLAAFADDYERSGEKDKSRACQERIIRELPDSEYARRAEAWLNDPSYPVDKRTCLECDQAAR